MVPSEPGSLTYCSNTQPFDSRICFEDEEMIQISDRCERSVEPNNAYSHHPSSITEFPIIAYSIHCVLKLRSEYARSDIMLVVRGFSDPVIEKSISVQGIKLWLMRRARKEIYKKTFWGRDSLFKINMVQESILA